MSYDIRKRFQRRVSGAERAMLMIPFNVVIVASIRGNIDTETLSGVLKKLRNRHPLLASRVELDDENIAWFVNENVPELNLAVIPRLDEMHWIARTEEEFKLSFSVKKGPLCRFVLLHSSESSDLIVCAHHSVCDGMSLTYLIRDILRYMEKPDIKLELPPDPPVIDNKTVPAPLSLRPVQRMVIRLINRAWDKKGISVHNERKELHKVFWDQNEGARFVSWTLAEDITRALVLKSREEKVTVNSALWAAFLAAQYKVQAPLKAYHQRAGMAVNTREKLLLPVDDAFGFYASSLTVRLSYDPDKNFWVNARKIHKSIKDRLKKTDLFRMIIADQFSPGLIDSIYFSKYGLIKSRISKILLKMMKFQKINYGYSITNVGRVDIPTDYGELKLDRIYGPAVYSDVNEKLIGVITVDDKMTFAMTYNEKNIDSENVKLIRDIFMENISRALNMK